MLGLSKSAPKQKPRLGRGFLCRSRVGRSEIPLGDELRHVVTGEAERRELPLAHPGEPELGMMSVYRAAVDFREGCVLPIATGTGNRARAEERRVGRGGSVRGV